EALDHRPATLLGLAAPDMDRRGEVGRLVLRGIAAPDAVLLVTAQAGREGHELVRLGAQGTDEDAAGHASLLVSMAADDVVVDHARGLHEGIADGRADELEAGLLQRLGHR